VDESGQVIADPIRQRNSSDGPYLPLIGEDELVQRNQAAIRLLDAWEADEAGEEDQRQTLAVLREALGERRIAASRCLFP